MIITHSLKAFLQARDQLKGQSVAVVPTMGALHEGHLALVKKAKETARYCIVTVFVNPLQFDQQEDFLRYPKIEAEDIQLLEQYEVDLVWFPGLEDIYPSDFATRIVVDGPALLWEGAIRQGHFSGVATVVHRLFSLIKPDFACFGEKDWQQIQVIKRMVQDLGVPVSLIRVPIVREKDGLAKSSRNRFLSSDERKKAPFLFHILQETYQKLQNKAELSVTLQKARQELINEGFKVDYFVAVDGESLQEISAWQTNARLIAAVQLGQVRLLDNI